MFNLNNHIKDYIEYFSIKYAQRMGHVHQRNREQYEWWDYEQLKNNRATNIEAWNTSVQSEPSLLGLINEAESLKKKCIRDCANQYGMPSEIASQMTKSYIGYSPAYGGYLCQLAPYVSGGFVLGKGHIIKESIYRFCFYVWRKRRANLKELTSSIASRIIKFTKAYGNLVELDPTDFSYTLKMQNKVSDKFDDPNTTKAKGGFEIVKHIESLNPQDPQVQEFFKNPTIEGKTTRLDLNAKGHQKLLKAYLGPWYNQTLQERMAESNKTEEEVLVSMMTDPNVMKTIYSRAYLLWEEASKRGDPSALAVGRPPQYLDDNLSGVFGQQGPSGPGKPKITKKIDANGNEVEEKEPATRTKTLISAYKIKQEILEAVSDVRNHPVPIEIAGNEPISESKMIADKLNKNPERMKYNKSISYQKNAIMKKIQGLVEKQNAGEDVAEEISILTELAKRKNPSIYTEEDVNFMLRNIEAERLQDPQKGAADISSLMLELDDTAGYDDLATAFNMAKAFFSAHGYDGHTGSKIGAATNIIFDPPENFINHTTQDVIKNSIPEVVAEHFNIIPKLPEDVDKKDEVATPEEIQEEIGDIETTPERTETEPLEETPAPEVGQEGAIPPINIEGVPPVLNAPENIGVMEQPAIAPTKTKKTKKIKNAPKQKTQQELDREELEALLGRTLNNLIKIASELDSDGKYEAAEEVHKVIRKYQEKL